MKTNYKSPKSYDADYYTGDFSRWRELNPRLSELWDELEKNDYTTYKPKKETPVIIKEVGCCLNWPNGIPISFAVQRREADKKKKDSLEIFNEMMRENIRPSHFNK